MRAFKIIDIYLLPGLFQDGVYLESPRPAAIPLYQITICYLSVLLKYLSQLPGTGFLQNMD